MGATLEVQRQEQMERLEEQMLRAQLLQHNIGGGANNRGVCIRGVIIEGKHRGQGK